jgi:hypothetical protein
MQSLVTARLNLSARISQPFSSIFLSQQISINCLAVFLQPAEQGVHWVGCSKHMLIDMQQTLKMQSLVRGLLTTFKLASITDFESDSVLCGSHILLKY